MFRAHAPPQSPCENLMCALKIAGQRASWRGPLGGHDLRRCAGTEQVEDEMNELKRFIEVDNHEAVNIGDFEKNLSAIKVVGPDFSKEIFPDAAVWEGVDEWTLRRGEEGFLRSFSNTPNRGGQQMRTTASGRKERNGRTCTTSSWR